MRAALALLGQSEVGPRGRRLAVLGDMLELGAGGADLHRDLAEPVVAHGVDLFCRPLMRSLWDALPPSMEAKRETSAARTLVLAIQRATP